MDDIIAVYNRDSSDFMERFKGECYPGLNLTNEDNDHYLESEIIQLEGKVHFKHWNKNKKLTQQLYYKGKDFYSVGPKAQ